MLKGYDVWRIHFLCLYVSIYEKIDACRRWFVPCCIAPSEMFNKNYPTNRYRAARRRSCQRNHFSLLESNYGLQPPDGEMCDK